MSAPQVAAAFALLVDAAAKGTLFLLAAFAATRAMRRRSAAARHLVWVVALGAMVLLPAASRLMPAWRVVPVPAPLRPATEFVAEEPSVAQPLPSAAPSVAPEPKPAVAPPTSSTRSETARTEANPSPAPAAPAFDWKTALLAAWAIGGVLLVLRLLAGVARVWWMGRRAEEITDDGWVRVTDALARRLRVGRMVTLLREAHALVPMTWGIVRPVVLLPADAERWDVERRTVVLAHELAHVRRWDTLTQWIAHLALALFWFHPLVWAAARRMREEREHACDDAVLSIGTRPVEYADHLLDIVRSLGSFEGPAAALAMARRSQFEGRLLAILDAHTTRGGVSRRLGLAAVSVALLAVAPLAALGAAPPRAPSAASAQAPAKRGVVDRLARRVEAALDAVNPRGMPSPVTALRDGGTTPPRAPHAPGAPSIPSGASAASSPSSAAAPGTAPTPPPPPATPSTPSRTPTDRDGVEALATHLQVSPDRAARMLQQGDYADVIRAADGIASSVDRAAVLIAILRRNDVGAADLAAIYRSATGMAGGAERVSVLREGLARYPLAPASVRDAFVLSVRTLTSDADMREVLLAVLRRPRMEPGAMAGVLLAARQMTSGADLRDVLQAVLARPDASAEDLGGVVTASLSIAGLAERRDVLIRLLRRPSLPADVLRNALTSAAAIAGSPEKRDVLKEAAAHQRIEGAVRETYLAAAATIAGGPERADALLALNGAGAPAPSPDASAASGSGSAARSGAPHPRTTSTHASFDDSGGLWKADVASTSDDGSRTVRIVATNAIRGGADGVSQIRPGGGFWAEETRGGVVRRAVFNRRADGSLAHVFTVDGRERPWEGEGRAWLSGLLREFAGR